MSILDRKKIELAFTQMLEELTRDEINSSCTLSLFEIDPKAMFDILGFLENHIQKRSLLLDLGCGYGFLARFFADTLEFADAHGVDIDQVRLEKAKKRLHVTKADLENNTLPYPNETLDLVISFGVLDHLKFFDNVFAETYRALRPEGLFLISLTNLGSWDSRICSLLGYQPRHVEISAKYLTGVPRTYLVSVPVGHIHTCTVSAIKELATLYDFQPIYLRGLRNTHPSRLVRLIDTIMANVPSLATRYMLVLKKK